nr:hypothetical protein [uncultured Neisseria sp.]
MAGISHEEASKWATKETIVGVMLGLFIGVPGTWAIRDGLYQDNKEDKRELQSKLDTCQERKIGLANSIQNDYVRKEELNRCQQDYAQKSDQNQRIKDENIKLLSQLQNKTACLQRQQQLQKQLNDINKEIQSGVPIGFSPRLLSEQERNERKVEREQLVEQLKQINCQ